MNSLLISYVKSYESKIIQGTVNNVVRDTKGFGYKSLTIHNESYCRIYIFTDELHLLFFVLQAVDVVGQAGKPKTITGFQTHTTPVLLAYGERAELATEECILTHISTCWKTNVLSKYKILQHN